MAPQDEMRSPSRAFRDLVVSGGKPWKETQQLLLSANLEMTVEQASELEFTLNDPNWEYFKSFGDKGPLGAGAFYEDLVLSCSGYTTDGGPSGMGGTTLRFQPMGIVRCRGIRGPLTRENLSPSQFVVGSAISCGMQVVTQESPQRPSISRDVPDDTEKNTEDKNEWTTLQRLAGEEGFLLFERKNTLFFGSPTWIMENAPFHQIGIGGGTSVTDITMQTIGHPTMTMSANRDSSNEISWEMQIHRAGQILPGHAVMLHGGAPGLTGKKLIVTNVSYPLAGIGNMSLTAKLPWEIEKQDQNEKKEDNIEAIPGGEDVDTEGLSITDAMIKAVKQKFPMMQVTDVSRSEPGSYHDYSVNKAVDFSNGGDAGTPEMKALAQWIFQNYRHKTAQLIHHPFNHNISPVGVDCGDGMSYYGSGTMNGHRNHVHWACQERI